MEQIRQPFLYKRQDSFLDTQLGKQLQNPFGSTTVGHFPSMLSKLTMHL